MTNSLYQDFSNGFLRKENIGYATPDVKLIDTTMGGIHECKCYNV
ncbi:hypothetical protein [Psychrobacillus sp. FJAT-21963]|nr:hypothetical protein [Psychrobacillus sp. FJAT-21963]